MKKLIKIETPFCDVCKKQDYVNECLGCGVEMCYECRLKNGISYNEGVSIQGSGDGFCCHRCNSNLAASKSDEIYNAYRAIKSLQEEWKEWDTKFEQRRAVVEAALRGARRKAK